MNPADIEVTAEVSKQCIDALWISTSTGTTPDGEFYSGSGLYWIDVDYDADYPYGLTTDFGKLIHFDSLWDLLVYLTEYACKQVNHEPQS